MIRRQADFWANFFGRIIISVEKNVKISTLVNRHSAKPRSKKNSHLSKMSSVFDSSVLKWSIKILPLTDTGENVQKWTRIFRLGAKSYLSLRRVGKKRRKYSRPLLNVFACAQVSSPRLCRLIINVLLLLTNCGSLYHISYMSRILRGQEKRPK